jgi:lysophospholipase L1-like esterase
MNLRGDRGIVQLEKGQKLLFIGDSITDADRARPQGEGLSGALGKGYVSLVDAFLQASYPELGIRVVNMGTGGHTVRDLKERWEADVVERIPDWLSVMIGTNDVWRQFDTPFIPEWRVDPEEYEKTLRHLVKRSLPQVKGLVLMTPFYLEPSRSDAMRSRMDEYGAIVKKIAAENETLFVDTQAAFDRVLTHLYPATLAWDRVHPTTAGHMVLARTFLNAVGFDWSRS